MACDPNALQWVTGVGTLVAIGFAARSARAAARSAGAAEENVALQSRPLLIDVPLEPYGDYEHDYQRPTGERAKTAWRGEIPANVEQRWISVPVRNVGRGTARLASAHVQVGSGDPQAIVTAPMRELTSQESVPPGEETRLGFIMRDEGSPHRLEFEDALMTGKGLELVATYTDIAGRQRQRLTLTLAKEPGAPWRVRHARHDAS